MDFGFSEEQEMFRRELQRFVRSEITPWVKEHSKQEGLPPDILKKLADMGLLGLTIPAEYGGQGADLITYAIMIEEISKADLVLAWCVSMPLALFAVCQHGTEEMRRQWMIPMVKGECFGCLALTEPHCGSDAGAIKTVARREGDNYIINGEKSGISFAMHTFLPLTWSS